MRLNNLYSVIFNFSLGVQDAAGRMRYESVVCSSRPISAYGDASLISSKEIHVSACH